MLKKLIQFLFDVVVFVGMTAVAYGIFLVLWYGGMLVTLAVFILWCKGLIF